MTRRAPSVRRTRTPRAPSPTQAALPAAISREHHGGHPQRLGVDERARGEATEHAREQAGAERPAHPLLQRRRRGHRVGDDGSPPAS